MNYEGWGNAFHLVQWTLAHKNSFAYVAGGRLPYQQLTIVLHSPGWLKQRRIPGCRDYLGQQQHIGCFLQQRHQP